MKFILIFIAAVLLFSCDVEKRSLNKTQLYLFKHPEFSAGYCADQFPDKADSVIVRDTVTTTDTVLFQDGIRDTIVNINNDTVRIIEWKIKIVTNTIRRDSVIYRENKAEQRRLELALLSCQDNNNNWLNKYTEQEKLLASWKGKAKQRWLWIALLIGGVVAYTGFKLFKTIKPIA